MHYQTPGAGSTLDSYSGRSGNRSSSRSSKNRGAAGKYDDLSYEKKGNLSSNNAYENSNLAISSTQYGYNRGIATGYRAGGYSGGSYGASTGPAGPGSGSTYTGGFSGTYGTTLIGGAGVGAGSGVSGGGVNTRASYSSPKLLN
jgi:hypothetical protein